MRLIPEFSSFGTVYGVTAGPVFPAYVIHFLGAMFAAFVNVQRARKRCLARSTRRRMGYLQVAMLTPAFGIFPFSLLLGQGSEFTLTGLFLVNLTNVIVVFMLLFLAYPLSFFGSRIPDRVVKVDLLRFVLRGPATGLLALVTITFTVPATRTSLACRGRILCPSRSSPSSCAGSGQSPSSCRFWNGAWSMARKMLPNWKNCKT